MIQELKAAAPVTSRSSNYAWYVALVLMLCNTLSFVDRQILGLLVVPIQRELSITDTQIGLLQGLAFGIFYTLLGIPMGRIADRSNRRNLVMVGILCWTVMTSLCAAARNFWSLFAARMGVGVGEATLAPSAFSLLSDYFPRERLGTALSIFSMGIFFGMGLALIVGGLIIGAVGSWRATFVIVGLPGLLAALVVYTIAEPRRKNLLRGEGGQVSKLSLSEVVDQVRLRWQSVAGICLALGFQALSNYAQQSWLPTYFVRVHGWAPRQTGLTLGIITLIAGLLGAYAGGTLCDLWQRRGIAEAPLRVGLLATLSAAIFFITSMAVPNLAVQLCLLGPAYFFLAMPIGSSYAALQLILPNEVRGQIGALQQFSVNVVGLILGPFVPGFLNDHVFRNPGMVGWSMAITVGISSLISASLFRATWVPYRKDYVKMK